MAFPRQVFYILLANREEYGMIPSEKDREEFLCWILSELPAPYRRSGWGIRRRTRRISAPTLKKPMRGRRISSWFPELALTGYSCQDLFFQDTLWTGVQQGIRKIAGYTKNYPNVTAVVGLPVRTGMRMYNCAAVISRGKIHALVPKTYIPNYNEFYEKRWFSSGSE